MKISYSFYAFAFLLLSSCGNPESSEQNSAAKVPAEETINYVSVGGADWTVQNLTVTQFSDGSDIPRADNLDQFAEFGEAGTPAWCYPDLDQEKGAMYGKLYNWYAVTDPRGLCPSGWRVANAEDWAALIEETGVPGTAGQTLKSQYGWYGNTNGTDALGFNALPGGAMSALNGYGGEEKAAVFWMPGEASANYANYQVIHAPRGSVYANEDLKITGMSVRCVRD